MLVGSSWPPHGGEEGRGTSDDQWAPRPSLVDKPLGHQHNHHGTTRGPLCTNT